MSRTALGEFEHLVLLAILRLGENAYGAAIVDELEERTGRSVNQAAAYLTLRRLEEKGWVTSELGDPTPERGGAGETLLSPASRGDPQTAGFPGRPPLHVGGDRRGAGRVKRPPRIPEWILGFLLSEEDRDEVLGDLHERYVRQRKRTSGPGADRWYWFQALRSLPRLAWFRARRQNRTLPNRRTVSMSPSPRFSPVALLTDFRLALRILVREPAFSATAAIILALGVGAVTTMFSITNGILKDMPLEESQRIVAVDRTDPAIGDRHMGHSWEGYDLFRSEQTVLEDLAAFQENTLQLAGVDGQPLRRSGAAVSPQLLPILRVQVSLGRGFFDTDAEDGAPPVMIISEDLWRDYLGGDPEIIGKLLRVDGVQRTVVGLLPSGFGFPSDQQVWIPLSSRPPVQEDDPGTLFLIGRLRDGVSLEEAEAQLAGIGRRMVLAHPESSQSVIVSVGPYAKTFVDPAGRIMLWIMLLVVSFVLVIAAANVANLLLSRAVVRSKQVAIRMALGGGRVRVIFHLLMESLVLAVVGGVGGLLISWGAVEWFDRTLGPEVNVWWITFQVDRTVLAFTAACVAGATLLAGTVPALQASGIDLQGVMRSESAGTTGFRQGRISRVLVVGQLTLSCALLILSSLMVRGVMQMEALNPGFEPEGVVIGRIDLEAFDYPDLDARRAFAVELEDCLTAVTGAEAVALSTYQAGLGAASTFYTLDPDVSPDGSSRPTVQLNRVSDGFFGFYRMPMLDGRIFDARDRDGGERVAVVNEAMAQRLAPGGSVVGRQIFLGRTPSPQNGIRIVGVVGDAGVSVWEGEPHVGIFLPFWEAPLRTIRLAVRTPGEASPMTSSIREVVAALDPNLPLVEASTLNEALRHLHIAERTFGILFGVFGVAALLLAVVGLYGVVAFSVNRRARELGVRRALGASPAKILWTTFGDGLGPLALGLALGIGLGWLLAPLLGEALFGSDPQDPLVFSLIPLLLASAASLGLWIPSKRASRADPMTVLRTE